MATVRLLSAVKLDSPYFIVGDLNAQIELSDDAARWAVAQNLAIPDGYVPEPEPSALLPEGGGEVSSQPYNPDEGQATVFDTPAEPPKRPYGNAPKNAWIEYACSVDPDLTTDRAEGMTKNDLMAKYGERLLLPHEEVHHKHGVRNDNRIEHLELWSVSQPHGQRVEDKTAWALEWLKAYAPELLRPTLGRNTPV